MMVKGIIARQGPSVVSVSVLEATANRLMHQTPARDRFQVVSRLAIIEEIAEDISGNVLSCPARHME